MANLLKDVTADRRRIFSSSQTEKRAYFRG
uniref:Uncharacterized protein n=1 Tax=Anguilla anguilla TaxID=7936 RepID=A0A0E9RU22_ANGAN